MNKPIYKIHGSERRSMKIELNALKSYVKNFWYCHNLDKDMHSFYGSKDNRPISDNDARKRLDFAEIKIKTLEKKLAELYKVP